MGKSYLTVGLVLSVPTERDLGHTSEATLASLLDAIADTAARAICRALTGVEVKRLSSARHDVWLEEYEGD